MRQPLHLALIALSCAANGCAHPSARQAPLTSSLSAAESLYADLRDLRDRIDVNTAAGNSSTPDGTPLAVLIPRYDTLRSSFATRLWSMDSSASGTEGARAVGVMRRTLVRDLGPLSPPPAPNQAVVQPDCNYDPRAFRTRPHGLDSLRSRLYACYGWTQSHVVSEGDTLDRLTVLAAIGRTESAEKRRELFLSLQPVWRSVNGDNGPSSPYRELIALEAKQRGSSDPTASEQVRASGVPPDSLERWLLSILETWRAVSPDTLLEPWDSFYDTGRASRHLSRLIPHDRLATLNREVYRALGADVKTLRVHFDLEPREGKTPVAYTTFGARPRTVNGAWYSGEPWIFATYRTGGLDNLNELLHETGHAIHIGAIRTRPAFADWPDSDPFTEAVADFMALDVYEPAWQQHWLRDSVPLAEGLRGRYGGIVLDVAWSVFELRMLRDPKADPNQVWTTLTRDYLRIRPHPELSWWAMRAQLVDAPGYMMNYAVGAILIAAIRARTEQLHGSWINGDSSWYGWIAPRLYRFGLERPTRQVVDEFLGGPVTPAALLSDMRRMSR